MILVLVLLAAPAAAQPAPGEPGHCDVASGAGCLAPARPADPPLLEVTLAVALPRLADIATTEWALSRGAREANPLLRGPVARRVALHAVGTAAAVWATRGLTRRHPRAGRVMAWTIAGVFSGVAANNAVWGARSR